MSFAIVSAIANVGFSIIDGLDTADYRSRVLREFLELQKYIVKIEGKLDFLVSQNREILEKLDALPSQIYVIVDTIVSENLLFERYSSVEAAGLLFRTIESRNEWEISSRGLDKFVDDMNFIYKKENRISFFPKMIYCSELFISIYGNIASNIISVLLNYKIEKISYLYEKFSQDINSDLHIIEGLMSNSNYIESYSFNRDEQDFSKIGFVAKPNRTKTEVFYERVCEYVHGDCCRPRRVCTDVRRERIVEDSEYNLNKSVHTKNLQDRLDLVKKKLTDLYYFNQMKKLIENYRESIEKDNILEDKQITMVEFSANEISDKGIDTDTITVLIPKRVECY